MCVYVQCVFCGEDQIKPGAHKCKNALLLNRLVKVTSSSRNPFVVRYLGDG